MTRRVTRVVLVDADVADAAVIRREIEADGDLLVSAVARDPESAATLVERDQPGVVAIALDLPDGGGQAVVERIMAEHPTPILVLSEASDGATPAVRALAAGAVEAMPKPATWTPEAGAELRRQIRRVGTVPVIRRRRPAGRQQARGGPGSRASPAGPVVAIAASTGGPPALAALLASLVGVQAPILVVQHIHPSFAGGFATWLGSASGRQVELAAHKARARDCVVYVAPGETHLRLGSDRRLVLTEEPAGLHRPSADVLLQSVAEVAGRQAVGVLLTGMGEDGAAGLLAIRRAGGCTLAQDEASSAVYGMPRAAVRLSAVDKTLPLGKLAGAIRGAVEERT